MILEVSDPLNQRSLAGTKGNWTIVPNTWIIVPNTPKEQEMTFFLAKGFPNILRPSSPKKETPGTIVPGVQPRLQDVNVWDGR